MLFNKFIVQSAKVWLSLWCNLG